MIIANDYDGNTDDFNCSELGKPIDEKLNEKLKKQIYKAMLECFHSN